MTMMSTVSDPLLFALVCVTGGCLVLALGVMVRPARPWAARALHVGVALFALLAGLAAAALAGLDYPLEFWGPPAGVAGLYVLVIALPSPAAARLFAVVVEAGRGRRGRLARGLTLAAAGPFVGVGIAFIALDAPILTTPEELERLAGPPSDSVRTERLPDTPLTTDRGRPVPIHQIVGRQKESLLAELWEPQLRVLDSFELQNQTIYVTQGWQECNCHGFVFTGGQFWIEGKSVDMILEDNGYEAVNDPRPGDVIVYRDRDDDVSHTGLVRGLASNGVVLVESKWGKYGRFVHRHDRHPYADGQIEFYRTGRPGHLLQGTSPGLAVTLPAPGLLPGTPSPSTASSRAIPSPL
jgi:hypothetical protein